MRGVMKITKKEKKDEKDDYGGLTLITFNNKGKAKK